MVHLHSVRLRGFKTFARPTELLFEPGVTVIIGPNGSGKSNIADAVLWVLGEQSSSNLRGRTMQDVIFTGPDGRKSSAVAEVSLVFDNECGTLPVEASQVEVTRRLMRDSASEYRLNGSSCRLLDVQDLFAGLGLGREMHSVVSQGKVDAILHSTPEARRALVEEAAGLGHFKKRRERTRTKLDRTRQNLLRVGDIEREVKRALRPLRQQVAAAERFAQATEEWALAKARVLVLGLSEAESARKDTEESLASLQRRRADTEERLAALRRQRADDEERFAAALRRREDLNAAYHRLQAEADRFEARALGLRQRMVRSEGELDRAVRREESARNQLAILGARVETAAGETTDETRLQRVSMALRTLEAELAAILPAYQAAGVKEDDLKDEVFELETARSRALQDRDFLRREVEEKRRLTHEVSGLVQAAAARSDELEKQAIMLKQRLVDAEARVAQARAVAVVAAARREEARSSADEATREERHLAELVSGLESRQAVLQALIARREGISPGARALMERSSGVHLLAELLIVQPGYERAVAAALGPIIQAVVLGPEHGVAEVLGGQGPLEVVWESQSDGAIGADRVSDAGIDTSEGCRLPPAGFCDLWQVAHGPAGVMSSLKQLLEPTAVAVGDDGPADLELPEDVGDWRLVSRSGEVVTPGVHAARRTEAGAEALLHARNELDSVVEELGELVARRDHARIVAAQALTAARDAEVAQRRADDGLREAEHGVLSVVNETDLHARRLLQAQEQVRELAEREERERDLAQELQADVERVESVVVAREHELERARTALRSLQAELEVARRRVAQLEDKKAQGVLLEVRLRERCRAQEAERERIRAQHEAAVADEARYSRRVSLLSAYLPALAQVLGSVERLASWTRQMVQVLADQVEEARSLSDDTGQIMREWSGAEAELQREHDEVVASQGGLQVDRARHEDRCAVLACELAELRRRHMSPRDVSPADVAGADAVSLSVALERAEQRRERIGPVNPLAEQECAEMEERARFLSEQRRDLEASLAQLQDVISGLDEHIDAVFTSIFAAASENFEAVIATIFPGAKGSLTLTESKPSGRSARGEDEAEGADGAALEGSDEEEKALGISLAVKFPNKAPRSMSLLSGGEKAMTAIAFLFALFLARPCPFYILDEVEASLDDVNIRRFLSLVRRYRDKTQFIIITHQRQTMEIADTLYGVALENDGTSRVLSRRFAKEKPAANAAAESRGDRASSVMVKGV